MLTLLALGIVSSIHGSPLAFKIENDHAGVVGCNSKFEGELIIPGKFQGKPVTAIGKNAFWRCRELTSVTLPNGVNSIAEKAFGRCNNLEKITIPESVTSIGNSAFYYCQSLTSLTLPKSVTSIGEQAFSNCSGLTYFIIPGGITIGRATMASLSTFTRNGVKPPCRNSAFAGPRCTLTRSSGFTETAASTCGSSIFLNHHCVTFFDGHLKLLCLRLAQWHPEEFQRLDQPRCICPQWLAFDFGNWQLCTSQLRKKQQSYKWSSKRHYAAIFTQAHPESTSTKLPRSDFIFFPCQAEVNFVLFPRCL